MVRKSTLLPLPPTSGKLPLVRANILTGKTNRNQSFQLRYKRAAGREEQTEAQERHYLPLTYLQANLAAAICLHASLGNILYPNRQTLSLLTGVPHLFNKSLLGAEDIIALVGERLPRHASASTEFTPQCEEKIGPCNQHGKDHRGGTDNNAPLPVFQYDTRLRRGTKCPRQ